jgi:hypothetical protein
VSDDYAPLLQDLVAEAQALGVPLVIGEYGMPWFTASDGDPAAEGPFAAQERLASDLIDAARLSAVRPWFADDRAEHFLFHLGAPLNWSLFRGEAGTAGPERAFITDVVARPYPQALAGIGSAFAYDHAARRFTLTYTPVAAQGRTDVYVPRARHYAATGLRARYSGPGLNGGILLAYDASEPSGLRVVENPGGLNAGAFAWDEARQVLAIREWLTGQPVTLELFPG